MNRREVLAMEIREAIMHARQVAENCDGNRDCKYQHNQLADWLEELIAKRDQLKAQLDEIERLREENKMCEDVLRDLSPCNQFSIGMCEICDNDRCGINFLMKKWRGYGKRDRKT